MVESAALEQALANPAAQYDAAKFTYVGRLATSNNVFMMWHTAKVQSLEDAKRATALLAGTGPGSIAETIPRLTNALIGTRFKLISGYPASTEAMLAMERGEVDGSSSSWAAVKVGKQDWLRDKKIRIILQTTPERSPELPDAPSLGEIGSSAQDRQVFALYASGSGSSSTSSLPTSAMKSASFTIASKPSRSAATRSAAMPGGPIKDRPIALPLA